MKLPVNMRIAAVVATVISVWLFWYFSESLGLSIDDKIPRIDKAHLAEYGASRSTETPRLSPIRLQRRAVKAAVDDSCAIKLTLPTDLDITQAEVFIVQDLDIADEPLVGADSADGLMDLRVGAAVPKLVAVKAPGAAVKLVEPRCPGTQHVGLRPEAKVSGDVYDRQTGLPVSAATVSLTLGAARLSALTASDGSFTISGVPSGVHRLTANTRDLWGRSGEPILLAEGAHATGVKIYVDSAFMLRGELDPVGRTSRGPMRIQLVSSQLFGGKLARTTSDDKFEFGPIPTGEYKLITTGENSGCEASLLRVETTVSMQGEDKDVRVAVGERHELRVLTVDSEGHWVADASLEISQEITRKDGLIDAVHRPVVSNSRGEARICGVSAGELSVEARGQRHTARVPGDIEIKMIVGDEMKSRVGGHLVMDDGEPVGLRDVLLIPVVDPGHVLLSRSDDAGEFMFGQVKMGHYQLEVRPRLRGPGAVDAGLGLSRPPEAVEEVQVDLGEEIEIDIVLPTAVEDAISGVVLDTHGVPVARAMVAYSIDPGGCWVPWDASEGSTTSDEDGKFVIERVHGSVPLRIHAMRADLGRGSVGDVFAGLKDVQVNLSEVGTLRVRASSVRELAGYGAYCNAAIVSDAGCSLGGSYLPSDGSPMVFDDLPATGVTVTLRCLEREALPAAALVLEPRKVIDLDLMPRL